ncbi:Vacuolar protein sorting-associated protein 54, variant 4 [Balamuthia mandrillaris]
MEILISSKHKATKKQVEEEEDEEENKEALFTTTTSTNPAASYREQKKSKSDSEEQQQQSKRKDEEGSTAASSPSEESIVKSWKLRSISAVLNDPSNRIVTKSNWKADFVVGNAPGLPPVKLSEFDDYFAEITKAYDLLARRRELLAIEEEATASTEQDEKLVVEAVPDLFFDEKFNLENPDTFENATGLSSPSSSNILLQSKLAHYLDVVEVELVKQISTRSQSFFAALTNLQDLHDEIKNTCDKIKAIRQYLANVDERGTKQTLKITAGTKRRYNEVLVYKKLKLINKVRQAQPTIQLLLANSDYASALDLINATQTMLSTELSGIRAFKHTTAQLEETTTTIQKMIQNEFIRLAIGQEEAEEEREPPSQENVTGQAHNEDTNEEQENAKEELVSGDGMQALAESGLEEKLVPLIIGLLRLGKIRQAFQGYRKQAQLEVETRVNRILYRRLLLPAEEKQQDSVIEEKLQNLEIEDFFKLLTAVFRGLMRGLARASFVHELLFAVLTDRAAQKHNSQTQDSSDSSSSSSSPSSSSPRSSSPRSDNSMMVTNSAVVKESYRNQIMNDSLDLLSSVCELMHVKAATVLKNRSAINAKFSLSEFVRFYRCCMRFVRQSEYLCRKQCYGLRGALLAQSRGFLETFHQNRYASMALILEGENWTQAQVAAEFQLIADELVALGEGGRGGKERVDKDRSYSIAAIETSSMDEKEANQDEEESSAAEEKKESDEEMGNNVTTTTVPKEEISQEEGPERPNKEQIFKEFHEKLNGGSLNEETTSPVPRPRHSSEVTRPEFIKTKGKQKRRKGGSHAISSSDIPSEEAMGSQQQLLRGLGASFGKMKKIVQQTQMQAYNFFEGDTPPSNSNSNSNNNNNNKRGEREQIVYSPSRGSSLHRNSSSGNLSASAASSRKVSFSGEEDGTEKNQRLTRSQSVAASFQNNEHEEQPISETQTQREERTKRKTRRSQSFSKLASLTKDQGMSPTLQLGERRYTLVNAALMLLKTVWEYMACLDELPVLSMDLLQKLASLLQMFNSRTCGLVLGAGAMQVAQLKSITAKHLALSAECIALEMNLIPYLKERLRDSLPPRKHILLSDMDRIRLDCEAHRKEIFAKLTSIMRERLEVHCRTLLKTDLNDPSSAKKGGVSEYMKALMKETSTLQRVLTNILPPQDVEDMFNDIVDLFQNRLIASWSKLSTLTPAGVKRYLHLFFRSI